MIIATLHLSFPHPPSFHSLASGACSHRQPLSLSHLTFSFPTLHILKNPPLHRLRRSSSPVTQPPPMELNDESDFETIASPDGYISICGFGSLLSERSARSTFPELINFRESRLNGFRRVYAHMAPIFFERGIAKPDTKFC
ncbi:hypothetical protein ACFX15_025463 [Malus domestica]